MERGEREWKGGKTAMLENYHRERYRIQKNGR